MAATAAVRFARMKSLRARSTTAVERMAQHQHRNEPLLAVALEAVDRGQDLGIVGAVEGGDQRLERGHVELGELSRAEGGPAFEGLAEQLDVWAPQRERAGGPQHRRQGEDRGDEPEGQVGGGDADDHERSRGLPEALAQDIQRRPNAWPD